MKLLAPFGGEASRYRHQGIDLEQSAPTVLLRSLIHETAIIHDGHSYNYEKPLQNGG
jgi:hypothetical protein